MILHVLIALAAEWLQRHQQRVITSLLRKTASSKLNSAADGCALGVYEENEQAT